MIRLRSEDKTKSLAMIITPSNWFEHFFHGVALDLWRQCVTHEQTSDEADFLQRFFKKDSHLLDVPCGNGRHSLELARRGFHMTGLDISREFLREPKAIARRQQVPARFVCGDMRFLDSKNQFDGAFCLGNSFGYFPYPDMIKFVTGVSNALRAGARFVIETGCVAECLLPTLKERVWYQIGDILFAIHNNYQPDVSCLQTTATFVRHGKVEARKFWHWVYTTGEIRRLLAQAHLKVEDLYGSLESRPFRMGDPRLFIVAKKSASARVRKKPARKA